jgi:flagellar biosynthetic protein FliR
MSFELAIREFADAVQVVAPGFALIFLRVAAMMIYAPLLGSVKIPKTVKALIAVMLSLGIASGIPMPRVLPQNLWEVTLAMGSEICFGLAMGLILSLTFIATQWGGEMIGNQMGLNISEALDPQSGGQSSVVGDMYFWMTLVIFLSVGGHRDMIRGVRQSFDALPVLSVKLDRSLFDLLIGLFTACSCMAVQLAGPMLVTMLIVDLSLGCISKTMPQLNVMTAGLTVRSVVGMIVLIVGVALTADVLKNSINTSNNIVMHQYSTPQVQ